MADPKKGAKDTDKIKEVRTFLGEAYGFIRGVQMSGDMQNYSLSEALSARIEEIGGTPASGRRNKLAMYKNMKDLIGQYVTTAKTIKSPDTAEQETQAVQDSGSMVGPAEVAEEAEEEDEDA